MSNSSDEEEWDAALGHQRLIRAPTRRMIPEIPVYPNRGIAIFNRERRKIVRKSTFQVTISSNVAMKSIEERPWLFDIIGDRLRRSSSWLFETAWRDDPGYLDIFNRVTGTYGNSRIDKGSPILWDEIDSIYWTPGPTEQGMKTYGKRVHIHGILEVYHYTKLRINQKRVQQYINYMISGNLRYDEITPPVPPENRVERMNVISGVYVNASYIRDRETLFLYNNKKRLNEILEFFGNE